MKIFMNENPTPMEEKLFRYIGYYKTEEDEEHITYSYVYDVQNQPFPKQIETKATDSKTSHITFYHDTENIVFSGQVVADATVFAILEKRMRELGWTIS